MVERLDTEEGTLRGEGDENRMPENRADGTGYSMCKVEGSYDAMSFLHSPLMIFPRAWGDSGVHQAGRKVRALCQGECAFTERHRMKLHESGVTESCPVRQRQDYKVYWSAICPDPGDEVFPG
jgi:hypothetical protein